MRAFEIFFGLEPSSSIWGNQSSFQYFEGGSSGDSDFPQSPLSWIPAFAEFCSFFLFCLPCIPPLFCSRSPHCHHPNFFLPQSSSSPRLGRQQVLPERLRQWTEWLHSPADNLRWNFRHFSYKHFECSTPRKFLKENTLLWLCGSQSPFPCPICSSLFQLPNSCSLLSPCT